VSTPPSPAGEKYGRAFKTLVVLLPNERLWNVRFRRLRGPTLDVGESPPIRTDIGFHQLTIAPTRNSCWVFRTRCQPKSICWTSFRASSKRALPKVTWTAAGIGRHQNTVIEWVLTRGGRAKRTGLEHNIRISNDASRLARSRPYDTERGLPRRTRRELCSLYPTSAMLWSSLTGTICNDTLQS
jgi:hypothetical protein